jgi:hypothetical protein
MPTIKTKINFHFFSSVQYTGSICNMLYFLDVHDPGIS